MRQCSICAVLSNTSQPQMLNDHLQDIDEVRVSAMIPNASNHSYPSVIRSWKAAYNGIQDLEDNSPQPHDKCLHHSTFAVIAAVASVVSVARLHRVAALICERAEHNAAAPPVLAYLLPLFCFMLSVIVFCQARYLAGDAATPKWLLAGLLLGMAMGYADGVDVVQLCLAYLPCTTSLMLGLSWLVSMHMQQHKASLAAQCCLVRMADSFLGSMPKSHGHATADSFSSKSNGLESGLQD